MRYKSVICAIVKNEQRYIREWVEHYLYIGFECIYIYEDFGSNSHKLQLSDYITTGKVVLTPLCTADLIDIQKRGTSVQRKLYRMFLQRCRNERLADWVGFFDVDEFLAFEAGWDLGRLEENFSNHGGVLLSWRIYGANGYIRRPNGSVVESYTKSMPDGFLCDPCSWQWNVKSLVNVNKCDGMRHIHIFNDCVFTDHSSIETGRITFTKAWINHYFTKSWDDFLERIFNRGNMSNNYRCLDGFFRCNPDLMPQKNRLITEQRYRHCASTMWISHSMKLISGGNEQRLKELKQRMVRRNNL